MSAHGHNEPPKAEFYDGKGGGPLLAVLGVATVVGLGGAAIGYFTSRGQFAFSWLYAFSFFFTICVGATFWVLLHHATDSGWSVVIRRQAENIAALFPVLALLFLPIVLVAKTDLFSWMTQDPHTDHILHSKSGYLNPMFFWIRAVGYFLFFGLVTRAFKRLSTRQDQTGDVALTLKMRVLSYRVFLPFAVALTFASVDWLMGLDYTWYSTMWGVYIFAGSAGASMAVLILLITALRRAGYLKEVITVEHYHMMGKLLFAFTVFWAYIGFSQYMLTWYANIPEETSYYLRRNTESWNALSILLVVGHFFAPFVFLIRRRIKQLSSTLCFGAVWILVMHWLDLYIIVMPILHPTGVSPSIFDLLTLVGIGGALGLVFMAGLGRNSLFPARDPRLIESLHVTN